MRRIKVLIVDDSAFMRKLITDFLSENALIEVVGFARDGQDALRKIKEFSPDVVTMDVEMPILNGLEALQIIMKNNPVPVVMVSTTTQEGAENTIKALDYGATDFLAKPSGSISLDLHKVKDELIQKVLTASTANIKHLAKKDTYIKSTTNSSSKYSKIERRKEIGSNTYSKLFGSNIEKLICIGTSTGGPRALQEVVTRLPENIDAPVFVVQHMPAGFTKSLANRLNTLSAVTVKEASHGETVEKGTVYIAPGGLHLKVTEVGNRLNIQLDGVMPPRNGHRPSVDVLFESLSHLENYAKISIIMTGMGSDGTLGLKELKKKGNVVAIAESEETAIVYGMPKAAIATQLIDEVHNVEDIADSLLKYV